ncbi:hypothetical protein JCM10212_005947 [Sporobolomyces blumeae]
MSDDLAATRLLFTGLHPSVAAQHLRSHLAQCPPTPPGVTDLKVVKRADGTSRCIAFAGFRSHLDAERTRAWTTGAWVTGERGGSRIKVEWAKDTRDGQPPAAKRTRLESGVKSSSRAKATTDDRFQDFLAVMAPSRSSARREPPSTAPPAQAQDTTLESLASDDNARRAQVERSDGSEASSNKPDAGEPDGAADDDALTDAEYLAKRMKRSIGDVQTEVETEDSANSERTAGDPNEAVIPHQDIPVSEVGPTDLNRQSILETGRLFIRNLAFTVTTEDLEGVFAPYGHLEQVHIPVDKSNGSPKGLAYVTFGSPQAAVAAFDAMDGRTLQGRLLHILPAVGRLAKTRPSPPSNSVKADRLEARKQTGGRAFSWATLYLNSNAALSAVADRLGVAKSALLDPSASDPAIKVALAEAHTLGEIKQYLENEGVNVDAFGKPGPRSATCILLKNLPYGSTESSLRALLAPFGQPNRILVPPSGTIAIVDMPDAQSASEAWRALLYKQFGGSVLYLEKAPSAIWSDAASSASTADPTPVVRAPETATASSTEDVAPGATLFVKNLNFVTTSARLEATFGHLDGFKFARVQTKPDPSQPKKTLSMGYGFIGFGSPADATRAKAALDRQVVDGHQLDVRFAQRGSSQAMPESRKSRADETTTKVLVKNVPFEATRKELRQLFSAYGQLKSVRLPRKMDNSTRGFAFLDFATRRDAEAAFAALEHTHLLGRHLVLQWAGEGDDGSDEDRSHASIEKKQLTHRKTKFTMGM